MDTDVDASYFQYLDRKKPYMMPVSPWFYTNMPGFSKNWMWRGDDMWHDRWIQVIFNKPEYVMGPPFVIYRLMLTYQPQVCSDHLVE